MLVGAAVALAAIAVVVAVDRRGDELPADALRLDYRAAGIDGEHAAEVMRARLSAAGVRDSSVSTGPDGRLILSGPPGAREDIEALTMAGRLEIYDWEASVLGPDGRPAPGDPRVTGGDDAGMSAATSLPQAERRAAVTGGRVVRTSTGAPERWYALGGEPALTNAGIASAGTARDVSGEPAVTLEFTQEGRAALGSRTRELARRGEERNAWQHLAIVLDDRIVAIPRVDFRGSPTASTAPPAPRSPAACRRSRPGASRRSSTRAPLPADLPAGR